MGAGPRRAQTKEAAGSGLGMPTRPHPTPPPKPGNWQGTLDGDPETWLSAAPAWHCPTSSSTASGRSPWQLPAGQAFGFSLLTGSLSTPRDLPQTLLSCPDPSSCISHHPDLRDKARVGRGESGGGSKPGFANRLKMPTTRGHSDSLVPEGRATDPLVAGK